MSKGNLVIGIYSHTDYYPPSLNAINALAVEYDHIYVVHRNIMGDGWEYPPNVSFLWSRKRLPIKETEIKPFLYKLYVFLSFSWLLCKTFNRTRATTLLIYDYWPLLSVRLTRFFMRKPQIFWYHSHDVAETEYIR